MSRIGFTTFHAAFPRIFSSPIVSKSARCARKPFPVIAEGNNINRCKVFWPVRGGLAKWLKQFRGDEHRDVVLGKAKHSGNFTRAETPGQPDDV